MSPFAGHAVRTAVNAAIDGDAPAASPSQDHGKNNVLAGTRAVSGLRKRQAIRVIRAAHFAPQRVAQVLVKRLSVEPRRIRVFHQTGFRGNGAGDSHADGSAASKFFFDFPYGFHDRAHRGLIVEPRRGDAMPMHLFAMRVERNEFDLGSSEIDSDSNAFLFFLSGRHRYESLQRGNSLHRIAQR